MFRFLFITLRLFFLVGLLVGIPLAAQDDRNDPTMDELIINQTMFGPTPSNTFMFEADQGETLGIQFFASGEFVDISLGDFDTWSELARWHQAGDSSSKQIQFGTEYTFPHAGTYMFYIDTLGTVGGYTLFVYTLDDQTSECNVIQPGTTQRVNWTYPEEAVYQVQAGGTACFVFTVFSDVRYSLGVETETVFPILDVRLADQNGNVFFQSNYPQMANPVLAVYYSDIFVFQSSGYEELLYRLEVSAPAGDAVSFSVHLFSHGSTLSGNPSSDYPVYILEPVNLSIKGVTPEFYRVVNIACGVTDSYFVIEPNPDYTLTDYYGAQVRLLAVADSTLDVIPTRDLYQNPDWTGVAFTIIEEVANRTPLGIITGAANIMDTFAKAIDSRNRSGISGFLLTSDTGRFDSNLKFLIWVHGDDGVEIVNTFYTFDPNLDPALLPDPSFQKVCVPNG